MRFMTVVEERDLEQMVVGEAFLVRRALHFVAENSDDGIAEEKLNLVLQR